MTSRTHRSFESVTIKQLETYLQKNGWSLDGKIRDVASVWHRAEVMDAEVLLPTSVDLKDYAERMRDVVESIARFEKRSIEDITSEILDLFSSIVSIRVIGADTKGGAIPISDGVLLVSKAKEMLMSAAMAMFAKRKQFAGKPPKEAASYIDSLLLGQTQVGSYVVNVLVPQQDPPRQDSIQGAEPVEGVALSLAHGLDALRTAGGQYDQTGDVAAFDKAVASGASANLCDALMGFSGEGQKRDFEIRISGASGPWFDGVTKVYSFVSEDVQTLKVAANYYRDDYVLRNQTIIGFVRKLHRDNGSNVGKVAIEASVNDSTRSVNIELDAKEYHEAVTAHDKRKWIECRGDIHIKGRTTRLLNHSNFRILEVGDLF
ncbi:hypothetical protein [Comamonas thiooxydans]|uniref:hypothetical protein n=1 Tax=Comamonas thiooxydans TaxID=363952 RepID=UPI0005F872A3|nr:hypothetical protein [Comamonas thiooxydans]CUB01437.1 hypothetical protein Ga0061062_11437 [Comamonas thiooxydans]